MSVFKNVFVILRGSLVAQGISFIALPLLSRLYLPEDFGRYQIFQSVVGFLLLSASLRYEVAILNAETDEIAFALSSLCLYVNIVLAALTLTLCAIVYYVSPTIVAKLGRSLWLLPPAMLVGGIFQTLTYMLLRSHAFARSSVARGIQALSNCATASCAGLLHITNLGLMWADIFGKVVATIYTFRKMIASDARYKIWKVGYHAPIQVLKKFRQFPLVSLPGSLLDGIAIFATPVMMFAAFGSVTSGQYAIVDRSISLPLGVVTQAVSQVFMASFSSSLRTRAPEAIGIFRLIVLTHFKIGVLPAALLLLFGPAIFSGVFGPQWHLAGEFARVLAPLFLVSFVVGPVNMSLLLLGRQRMNLAWYVLRVAAILLAWSLILRLDLPPMSALLIHVTINIVAYLVFLLLIYRTLSGLTLSANGH